MVEIKKFKLSKFKKPTCPLTDEGMKALGIVLGTIAFIAGAFYLAEFAKRQEPTVLPARVEEAVGPKATEAPTETLESTASPMLEVTASPSAQF